jgi:hypothetical protein
MGDYGGITWYPGKMSDHALQIIIGGCFHVRVTLAPVGFANVDWRNCSSFHSVVCLIFH